jgi:hypothetical protein
MVVNPPFWTAVIALERNQGINFSGTAASATFAFVAPGTTVMHVRGAVFPLLNQFGDIAQSCHIFAEES